MTVEILAEGTRLAKELETLLLWRATVADATAFAIGKGSNRNVAAAHSSHAAGNLLNNGDHLALNFAADAIDPTKPSTFFPVVKAVLLAEIDELIKVRKASFEMLGHITTAK